MARQKKAKTLVIKADQITEWGPFKLGNFGDEAMLSIPRKKGSLKTDGCITYLKRQLVKWAFLNKKTSQVSFTISGLTADELLAFAKKAKARENYWRKWNKKRKSEGLPTLPNSFYLHLNPEMHFFFKYKRSK